jgi:hypothetical protein
MRSLAEILLWTLPDAEPSEREDYIRIRNAESRSEVLETDYPIWLSAVLNVIFFWPGITEEEAFWPILGILSLAFVSIFITATVGMIIQNEVCLKIGFIVNNSYDRTGKSGRYVAQSWPGGSLNIESIKKERKGSGHRHFDWAATPRHPLYQMLDTLQKKNAKYFKKQSEAWRNLYIKANLIGMLVSICFWFLFFSILPL